MDTGNKGTEVQIPLMGGARIWRPLTVTVHWLCSWYAGKFGGVPHIHTPLLPGSVTVGRSMGIGRPGYHLQE